MKKHSVSLLTAIFLVLMASPLTPKGQGQASQGQAQQPPAKFLRVNRAIPNQYNVALKDDVERSKVRSVANDLARAHGGRIKYVYEQALKGFAVEMPEPAALALSNNPQVKYVEEDGEATIAETRCSGLWGLDRIDQQNLPLNGCLTYYTKGTGVNIYVIDTGIRTSHKQFSGRAAVAFDAFGGNGQDCNGHGTHVAGTAGGGMWGVATNARLYSVRVLDCSGVGSASTIVAGVNFVTSHHASYTADVANMSLTMFGVNQFVDDAVRGSIASGVTYVLAAGNASADANNYSPARVPEAITVGATGNDLSSNPVSDQAASFTNYGPALDVFAPGVGIQSAWYTNDSGGATLSGTSMAAPHVAGTAALYLEMHPSATPSEVANAIISNATPNVVINPGAGSPNRLLSARFSPALCNVPLYRSWNEYLSDHYYTTDFRELGSGTYEWNFQRVECKVFVPQLPDTVPLYRYWNGFLYDHFYTTDFYELSSSGAEGWNFEQIQGYVYSSQQPGTVPLYRYWNETLGDHFYTTDFNELGYGAAGWLFDRIECYVLPAN